MGRFNLDSSISRDIKSVASDSFVDRVKMIEYDKLIPSNTNFYDLSELELLSDDIERQGLKQNLVVIENESNKGTFFIKCGHRRHAAIGKMIDDGRMPKNPKLPCYVETEQSKNVTQLNLIMLNATQRNYSDSDIMQEHEQLVEILENLKAEGREIKGRMRDNIAKILNISPAQVGKIENVKHRAVPEIIEAVKNGDMTLSTANEIAKLDTDTQEKLLKEKNPSEISHKEVKKINEKNNEIKIEKSNDFSTENVVSNSDFDELNCEEEIDTINKEAYNNHIGSNAFFDNIDADKETTDSSLQIILSEKERWALTNFLEPTLNYCKLNEPYAYTILIKLAQRLKGLNENS